MPILPRHLSPDFIGRNSGGRSIHYSPFEHPKVACSGKPAFIPVHWKLITLQDLEVDLKFEFNQSNRGLYGKEAGKAILAESQKAKAR